MYLQAFSNNPYGANCWLLSADGSDDAVVIDPGFFADRVLRLLDEAGKRPVAVLATHGHFDHTVAAEALCGSGIPFHIHNEDELALSVEESEFLLSTFFVSTLPISISGNTGFVGVDLLSCACTGGDAVS